MTPSQMEFFLRIGNFKNNGDVDVMSNYRPISVIGHIAKMVEQLVRSVSLCMTSLDLNKLTQILIKISIFVLASILLYTVINKNHAQVSRFDVLLYFPFWPFVLGIHRSPVNSPHKGQWRGALTFSLIYAWTISILHICVIGTGTMKLTN